MKAVYFWAVCFLFFSIPIQSEKLYGINYSPFIRGIEPGKDKVSESLIRETLTRLKPFTLRVRTFSSGSGLEKVPKIAKEMGFKVVASAWISNDPNQNETEIRALLQNARYAEMVVVGSETLLRGDVTPAQLIDYIKRVRADVRKQGLNIPVTTADLWSELKEHADVRYSCDVIYMNIYPFWEKKKIDDAIAFLDEKYHEIKRLGENNKLELRKPAIISESGWPSDGEANGEALPSLENAAKYFQDFRKWTQAKLVKSFWFEAFDEDWKTSEPGDVGTHWGMFYDNGSLTMKPGFEFLENEALKSDQEQNLRKYAVAGMRYFISAQSNNKGVGFTHAFLGTGRKRNKKNGETLEWEEVPASRGYGSHVNINEVTLRFLCLATGYKKGWLDFITQDKRYQETWGQILKGLRSLRTLQTSGNSLQYHASKTFHRAYLTVQSSEADRDRTIEEIQRPTNVADDDRQSSDDNGLPFINLLVLQGLANDSQSNIPDKDEIISLCQSIREDINIKRFVVNDKIVFEYVQGTASDEYWDRKSAEGHIILASLLLSKQITRSEFYQIATSLENYPVDWSLWNDDRLGYNVRNDKRVPVKIPSFHSAMFMHGLRIFHGLPITQNDFFQNITYFEKSLGPTTSAHLDYARHYGFKALGTQVMSQALEDYPLAEYPQGHLVQFPGNESNDVPIPNENLSRATAPHAWFIPLARWKYIDPANIDTLFSWMSVYESQFFQRGSDTKLGWEAVIPWTPSDTTYSWVDSNNIRHYSDEGRPVYEALNNAYMILSIFDALNPSRPLFRYNIEQERCAQIARYFDEGVLLNEEMFP